jgi:protein SCO1/2
MDQRLDATIPLDLTFRDEAGRDVRLGSFFHGKSGCGAGVRYPCSRRFWQRGQRQKARSLDPGRDFEVVAFSLGRRTRRRPRRPGAGTATTARTPPTAGIFPDGRRSNIRALTTASGIATNTIRRSITPCQRDCAGDARRASALLLKNWIRAP